jgi:predicted ATPase
VVERTGGVPLFVEELTRAVLESGSASGIGRAIPATLHDSLMARLDRLGPAKELVQIGAVIGNEFSYRLLHAVHPVSDEDLQGGVLNAIDAELIHVQGMPPDAIYRFKHALIRDAAYEALLKSKRKELHARVAELLIRQFPERVISAPELVAHHYTEAGVIEEAIPYWQQHLQLVHRGLRHRRSEGRQGVARRVERLRCAGSYSINMSRMPRCDHGARIESRCYDLPPTITWRSPEWPQRRQEVAIKKDASTAVRPFTGAEFLDSLHDSRGLDLRRAHQGRHNASRVSLPSRLRQIVAAMAEPGVGKSRLYFEFKAREGGAQRASMAGGDACPTNWMVLETISISHGKASAYLPVLDLLQGYFKIAGEDDQRTRRAKVTGNILTLDRSLEDTLPYMFSLLGIVEGADPLAQMDGQLKKRRTLEGIKRILLRESLNQPLMVIFEDLHWIDEATQEFLNLLADSLGTAKLLLLVNYRPEYSHKWNSKTYYTQLRLDPLGKESAEEMLSALLTSPAPAALAVGADRERSAGDLQVADRVRVHDNIEGLKRLILDKTEGNPFFMEETVQVLLDEGALVRGGAAVRLTQPLNALKIPPTVQGILAARIDRLPADAKELLQTLAVLGREFPISLIGAVVTKSDDELNRLLNDLQLGEFIYEQLALGDTEYIFKHALTQEVAAGSVLVGRRRALHERIGNSNRSAVQRTSRRSSSRLSK